MRTIKSYDIVFLTNTPSFYKLNLCNKIAEQKSLLLVLYGYGSEAVNTQIELKEWNFDFIFINYGDANHRNKFKTLISLLKLMKNIRVKRVFFSGWMAPEYNIYAFISPKRKNVCICESTIFESSFNGISGWIKKRIINRMSAALPSGKPHDEIFERIGFKGPRYMTGSVGIFHKPGRHYKIKNSTLKYLYVGRLVDVKNISLLIEAFNKNKKPLTIAGDGPLRSHLQSIAKENIKFIGFIKNEELGKIYEDSDIFILPSKSETWGLVIEEAIYWGLPVIVSDHVGCSIDMVHDLGTGEIFESGSLSSLLDKIDIVEKKYNKYFTAVANVDFEMRERNQIQAYLNLFT